VNADRTVYSTGICFKFDFMDGMLLSIIYWCKWWPNVILTANFLLPFMFFWTFRQLIW
jgi:hypothetical protein